ncbi:MAG: molybdenum cofactor guanylyltransferase [Bacteroidales bacterium]
MIWRRKKWKTNKELNQNIDAVILAGGKNHRFQGKHKSLALLKGKSILQHQLDLLKPIFSDIILVSNHKEEFSAFSNIKVIADLIPDKGPLSGIHAGLETSRKPYTFVFAGDMPFLDKNLINQQIKIIERACYDAVIPETSKGIEPLHGIYSKNNKAILTKILKRQDIYPVKELLFKNATYYWKIAFQKAFININTPEELDRLNNDRLDHTEQ